MEAPNNELRGFKLSRRARAIIAGCCAGVALIVGACWITYSAMKLTTEDRIQDVRSLYGDQVQSLRKSDGEYRKMLNEQLPQIRQQLSEITTRLDTVSATANIATETAKQAAETAARATTRTNNTVGKVEDVARRVDGAARNANTAAQQSTVAIEEIKKQTDIIADNVVPRPPAITPDWFFRPEP